MDRFRDTIARLCHGQGWSANQAARRCGIPRSTWHRFMFDRWADPEQVHLVCLHLGTSPADGIALLRAYIEDVISVALPQAGLAVVGPGERSGLEVTVPPALVETVQRLAGLAVVNPALREVLDSLAGLQLRAAAERADLEMATVAADRRTVAAEVRALAGGPARPSSRDNRNTAHM